MLGGSYGGYMTSWIVSHTDRFKAACSERAVNNLLHGDGLERHLLGVQGYFGASHTRRPTSGSSGRLMYAEQDRRRRC